MVSNIPSWTTSGIIPPVRPGQPGHSVDRSPYRTSLEDLIMRFGSSQARLHVLERFLDFRAALHAEGIKQGKQWLDGSFVEDKETLLGMSPADIDVVTFMHLPFGRNQAELFTARADLFDNDAIKTTYKVDGYFQILGNPTLYRNVREASYWYSMWSHTRAGEWKGFLEVDLDPASDADARQLVTDLYMLF